jgi:hypothetical protein
VDRQQWVGVVERVSGTWMLPLAVVVLGPLAMVLGLISPPEALFGPNAALGLWAPLVFLGLAAIALVAQRHRPEVTRSVWRRVLPYLLVVLYGAISLFWTPDAVEGSRVFLQLAIFAPVFVVAWVSKLDRSSRAWLRWAAAASIGAVGTLFVYAWVFDVVGGGDLSRLMGIATLGLAPMFVIATYSRYSRSWTLTVGVAALVIALASDARMVALVVGILVLTSPALEMGTRMRVGLAAAGLAVVVGLAAIDAPDLFYFNQGDSLSQVIRPGGDVLSGRPPVWSELIDRCSGSALRGSGLGASNVWGAEINSAFTEPHNEYVRTICDLGVPAMVVYWGFFVAIGARALSRVRGQLQPSASGVAALQMLVAFGLLALTDIPIGATAQLYAPLALVLGWSERAHADRLR